MVLSGVMSQVEPMLMTTFMMIVNKRKGRGYFQSQRQRRGHRDTSSC
jgi:hypothetical protein